MNNTMSNQKNWLNTIQTQIQKFRSIHPKDIKRYKIDQLERIAKRVEQFSQQCSQCSMQKQEITKLAHNLEFIKGSTQTRKEYHKKLRLLINHLQKKHKLVAEGQYIGIGIAIGVALGVPFMTVLGGAGIALGIPFGLVFGIAMENKAKKEGKII